MSSLTGSSGEALDYTRGINCKPVDFEDAIILAGYGRFQRRLLFTSGFCIMAVVMEVLNIAYVLPAAYCDLQMTSQYVEILNAMIFIGMMVSSHSWGFLADTQGRKYILIFTLLLNCLCTIVSSFSFNFWMLAGLRFLNGIFICAPSAVTYAYISEFHSRVTQTKAIVLASSFKSLGSIAIPGMALLVLPQPWTYQLSWYKYSSWRMFQLLTVIPGLLAAAIMLFCMPESPKFLLSRGRHREALKVLQHIFTVNSGCRADQYPVTALIPDCKHTYQPTYSSSKLRITRYMWDHTKPLFVSPYRTTMMLLCLLQFGLFLCASGVMLWMPDFLTGLEDLSPHSATSICDKIQQMRTNNKTLIVHEEVFCSTAIDGDVYHNMLIVGGATILGYLLAGFIINRIGRKCVLFGSLMVSGCAGVGLYFLLESYHILTVSCVFVATSTVCISIVSSTTVQVFPTNIRAMAMCISLMMGRLAMLTASILMGYVLETYCNYLFFSMGGIAIVCGFLSLLLPAHLTSLPPTLMT